LGFDARVTVGDPDRRSLRPKPVTLGTGPSIPTGKESTPILAIVNGLRTRFQPPKRSDLFLLRKEFNPTPPPYPPVRAVRSNCA